MQYLPLRSILELQSHPLTFAYICLTILNMLLLELSVYLEEKNNYTTRAVLYEGDVRDLEQWDCMSVIPMMSLIVFPATDVIMFFLCGYSAWSEGYTDFFRATILTFR